MSTKFRDEAIPLITFTENKFQINPEAIEILKAIEAPMSIIGVAGAYRSGKSYLLNRVILNQDKGFGVGSTINACTKGIWMWARPIKAQTEENTLVNMVVIDSEGLGSLEADASHDCRIFALILLISSTFLYNSVGAIDENSISNLSVVINITKHLSVKATKSQSICQGTSQGNSQGISGDSSLFEDNIGTPRFIRTPECEDVRSSEYSKYFPDFYWVLRDFSLQMVDEYGDEITPHEYLENALQMTDESSVESETKNKIRELICAFFQQRRCFPLVRPVINETDLSNLSNLKLENLRGEFVEGILGLKNSLLHSAKVKKINQCAVNGEVLSDMLASYIDTMNEGAVPNIENTWFYVTQKQAGELMAKSIDKYQAIIKSQVRCLIPSDKVCLREKLDKCRETVMLYFRESSFLTGVEQEAYTKLIGCRICQEEKVVLAENEAEFENLLEKAMQVNYRERIYTPIINDSLKDLKDLTGLLKAFKANFEGIEPNGPHKTSLIHKFLFAKSCESFAIFAKNVESKFKAILGDKKRESDLRAEQLLEELQCLDSSKTEIAQKLQIIQNQISGFEFENSKLAESVKFLEEEKSKLEKEFENCKVDERAIFKRKNEELAVKLDESKTQLRFLENLLNQQKSEFEIEKSLLTQKAEFANQVEKDLNEQRVKTQIKQKEIEEHFESKLRCLTIDFESKLAEKTQEICCFKNQRNELKDEISGLRVLNGSFHKETSDKEQELQIMLNCYTREISELKSKLNTFEAQANMSSDECALLSEKLAQVKLENTSSEKRFREKEERLKMATIELESNVELLRHENEFLKSKLEELETEVADARKLREMSTQALNRSPSYNKPELTVQIQEVKTACEQKIVRLLREHDLEKKGLNGLLNSQSDEYDAKIGVLKEEKEKLYYSKLELQKLLETSVAKSKNFEEKVQIFERTQTDNFKSQILDLEIKLKEAMQEREMTWTEKEDEISANRKIYENNLSNLKLVFETEKSILEKKLGEEKSHRENLIRENLEELCSKKDAELLTLDEEVEALKSEIMNQDSRYKSVLGKTQTENSDLRAKMEALERKTTENLNTLHKKQTEEINKLKLTIGSLETERAVGDEKLNYLKIDLKTKNMEIFKFQQLLSAGQSALQKAITEKDKINEESVLEIQESRTRFENIEEDKFSLNEELINAKIFYSKELALKNQKIEHIENKLAELNQFNEIVQKECDDKLKSEIAKHGLEIEETKAKKSSELQNSQTKNKKKQRTFKETESAFSAKIAELEKTKCVLQEKNLFLESKINEVEENTKNVNSKNENDLKKLKEQLSVQRTDFSNELENLKTEKYELEIRVNDLLAKQDKEKAITEARISFIEIQNKKLKTDLTESQTSFDTMFQNFQQFRANDKEETKTSHTTYVISLEERYSAQIQDLKEQTKNTCDGFKQKIKNLEREIKKLEVLNEENMGQRFELNMIHEKKTNELIANEKTAMSEIEHLKNGIQKLTFEQQKDNNVKIESLKKKISEQEIKLKTFESDKNLLAFKQEKMRTNWNIEKDHLISGKTDLLENIDRVKRQCESLNRENEKLKSELKVIRKNNTMGSFMNIGGGKGVHLGLGRTDNVLKDVTGSYVNENDFNLGES